MLFDYGIVMSIIILLLYVMLIKKTVEIKDYWLLVIILFTLVRAFVEPFIVSIEQNLVLIAFVLLLENKKSLE